MFPSYSPLEAASLRRRLSADGYCILHPVVGEKFRERAKDFIDAIPEAEAALHYAGTEKRIWTAHRKDETTAAFRDFSDFLLSQIFVKSVASRDLLAIRNLPVPDSPDLMRGRWHLDSLRSQIKVFLFLTDVTDRNGPLETIPGSHRFRFKAKHVLGRHLVRPTDFLGRTRLYQSLDDKWVEEIARRTGGPRPFICRAGTIMVVDTSAIHRARPCLENCRYALTAYYDHF